MAKVIAKSWSSILDFYKSLSKLPAGQQLTQMLELVETIIATEFAPYLYPITSMHVLILSDLPEFDTETEILRIEFDPKASQFRLEYQETTSPLYKRWRKTCSSEDVFPSSVRFLKMKNWGHLQE